MQLSEQRKIKGNNFAQQIENSQKFKQLIQECFESQKEEKSPLNFIRETALTPLQIVKIDGNNCLKNYMYKGTLSHFEFMNNPKFIQALEYVDRPKIKNFKP